MIEIKIDHEKLVQKINENTVTVSFKGFKPFIYNVVNARKLLETIHEVADCDEETFIDYVNNGFKPSKSPFKTLKEDKYKQIPEINVIFENIKMTGTFLVKGQKALGKDPYIEISAIKNIITGL